MVAEACLQNRKCTFIFISCGYHNAIIIAASSRVFVLPKGELTFQRANDECNPTYRQVAAEHITRNKECTLKRRVTSCDLSRQEMVSKVEY